MTTAQSTETNIADTIGSFSSGLQTEARELDSLSVGLKRHVTAWRAAHDSTVDQLTRVLSRMDSILERIERNRSA